MLVTFMASLTKLSGKSMVVPLDTFLMLFETLGEWLVFAAYMFGKRALTGVYSKECQVTPKQE